MRYNEGMNGNITRPIFTAIVPAADSAALLGFLEEAAAAVSVIERSTSRLLNHGHQNKIPELVSFGHDVLATLFFFPFQARKIKEFLTIKAQQEEAAIKNGELNSLETFFYKLRSAATTPTDRTLNGRTYPANWKSRTNIPSLMRGIQSCVEDEEMLENIAAIESAVKTLHAAAAPAVNILDIHAQDIAQQKKEWMVSTDEGREYSAQHKKNINAIIAALPHRSID